MLFARDMLSIHERDLRESMFLNTSSPPRFDGGKRLPASVAAAKISAREKTRRSRSLVFYLRVVRHACFAVL